MDSKLRCVFVEGEARDNAQEEQSPSEATESQVRVTLIINKHTVPKGNKLFADTIVSDLNLSHILCVLNLYSQASVSRFASQRVLG